MSSLSKLKPVIRLSVVNPQSESTSAFGQGIASLCQGVRDLGSLNAAAKSMGMAYSKAWRIIKDTEEALGFQLLDRDGAHGSTLTKEGAKLLNTYMELQEAIQKQAEEALANALK